MKQINNLSAEDNRIADPVWIPDKLEYYCKPKSMTLLLATEFKIVVQGFFSLPEFIIKATLPSIQCKCLAEVKDRLLWDVIVIGVSVRRLTTITLRKAVI